LIVQAFLFSGVIQIEKLESYDKEEQQEDYKDKEAMRIKFRLLGLLGKGYNIVVHIRGSPSRIV
jgi:hypothetical protein